MSDNENKTVDQVEIERLQAELAKAQASGQAVANPSPVTTLENDPLQMMLSGQDVPMAETVKPTSGLSRDFARLYIFEIEFLQKRNPKVTGHSIALCLQRWGMIEYKPHATHAGRGEYRWLVTPISASEFADRFNKEREAAVKQAVGS